MLSKEHTILERPFMEFRPFGVNEQGEKIRDISGVIVRSSVEYLEEHVTRTAGSERGKHASQELCRLLNDRIRDPVYHVTSKFLRNPWNSYSYEFVSFLREFCVMLSGDAEFSAHAAMEKHNVSPLIKILGRPFPLSDIYKMWAHFGQKYAIGSLEFGVGSVTERSAVLRMKFTDKVYRQFGPYRSRCAELACQSAKRGLSMLPEQLHHLRPAVVTDRSCIVNGDEWCEWEFTWSPQPRGRFVNPVWGLVLGAAVYLYLRAVGHVATALEAFIIVLLPGLMLWLGLRPLRKQIHSLKALIKEQDQAVDARHEELREAYLEQEGTAVELRRKVGQLTALHQAGLLFGSTLDRAQLLQNVLQTIVRDLRYDRAMIAFYDRARHVSHDIFIHGVPEESEAFARTIEVPVRNPRSLEGVVLLEGRPILINDVQEEGKRLHPFNDQLASLINGKSMISVPLKVKNVIIGSLTVDRIREHSLTQDDLDLMVTVAGQVAIALDNVQAYQQIEELNVGLEEKVRERTLELEKADRLRSLFLSHVSHELRTPLTAIKGSVENMLAGMTGPLLDKQQMYLLRVGANIDRLTRMIADLLDRTRIETGTMELSLAAIPLRKCIEDALEQVRPLAMGHSQQLDA